MTLLRSLLRNAPNIQSQSDSVLLDAYRRGGNRYFRPTTAMQISAVYRAIKILADVIASLPIDILTEKTQGGITTEVSERPPMLSAIWRRPNPEVNRFVFWNTVAGHLVATGNAFLWVDPFPSTEGSSKRSPMALWPISPHAVRVGRDRTRRKIYEIAGPGGVTPQRDWVDGGNIIHIQGFGSDGLIGLSPIELGASTIANAYDAGSYSSAFLRNSSAPVAGYLSTDQRLTPEQAQEIAETWEQFHKGPENVGRAAVLGSNTKWMTVLINPKDAQLLESRTFEIEEISRWFGVPLHLLSSHTKDTSWGSGLFEQNRALLVFTVDPLLVNIELTISDELIWQTATKAAFIREGLLRPNPLERAQYLSILRQNGVINADEWRAKEGMAPIPNGGGQSYGNPNTTAGA